MSMAASFGSYEEYNRLMELIETLSDCSSGGKGLIGMTLDELMAACSTTRGNVQHILAALGKKIKRTKPGTYFYMPNLNMVPKRRAAKLFYK